MVIALSASSLDCDCKSAAVIPADDAASRPHEVSPLFEKLLILLAANSSVKGRAKVIWSRDEPGLLDEEDEELLVDEKVSDEETKLIFESLDKNLFCWVNGLKLRN